MRKIRNIKKANLFWKGKTSSLLKKFLSWSHSFSYKLGGFCLQSFSEEGSWMKHQHRQRFASMLKATQKILKNVSFRFFPPLFFSVVVCGNSVC